MGRLTCAAMIISVVLVAGVRAQQWPEHEVQGQYFYGYASAGDDPARFMPEVEANRIPTNVQSLSVSAPSEDITMRVELLRSRGQRTVVVLDLVLFKHVGGTGTCGADTWRPWLNYQERFAIWRSINSAILTPENIAFVVVNTEVNNRCIDAGALDLVTQHVKAQLPGVRAVAGYGRTDGAKPLADGSIPASLDGVLFFRYYTFDPTTDQRYQEEFANVVGKLTETQRVIIVPDGFYGPGHAAREWPKWYLGYLALNHVKFAQSQSRVVGVMFLQWPDAINEKTKQVELQGSRSLPQSVRDRQREAGCSLNVQNLLSTTCN
jgi:hypothetical protein